MSIAIETAKMFKSQILTRIPRLFFYHQAIRLKHSVIGIDLGTTNSAVAFVEGQKARILENEEGRRTTPSVVAYLNRDNKEEYLVGEQAKRQAVLNSKDTIFASKRLMGRKFIDSEVQEDINNVPFKIVPHENGDAWIETTKGKRIAPTQVGAAILKKMAGVAESHLNEEIKHAVVTVPAYFNDSQRQATKYAGKIAGLNVLRVINEPTAASLAYGIDKKQRDGIIAVYDLGGGTFDISILDVEQGIFEVRATSGNTHLGGEDFDILLQDYIINRFNEESGIDLLKNNIAVQRIRETAEKCKIELSHVKESSISIPFVVDDKHIDMKITEEQLDEMSLPLIEKTIEPVKKCIKDAGLKVNDINEVLLVGGMTRMPKIRKTVESVFNKKPSTAVNPDEAVALGAAIQGAVLSGQIKNVVLLDVTSLSLGIETYGGIFSPLIPRNTSVPVKKEQVFSTAVDGQTGVELRVFQGERPLVKDNKLIGKFKLSNIPVAPKGVPQIAVSFEIDADGIINVSARDKTPYEDAEKKGNAVSIQVSAETGLTESEINQMIAESSKFSKSDQEYKNHIENAARADIVCSDTESALIRFGELMEPSDKDDIQQKVNFIRSMIVDIREGKMLHSIESVKNEVEELQKLCLVSIQKIAAKQQNENP